MEHEIIRLGARDTYSYPVYTNMKIVYDIAELLGKALLTHLTGHKVLVVRGSSGLTIAIAVSTVLTREEGPNDPKHSIHYIRKPLERSHHVTSKVEYYPNTEIVILDDFISNGDTMNAIVQYIPIEYRLSACCREVYRFPEVVKGRKIHKLFDIH